MTTLSERESELIEIFDWIEDETDRYVQIIEFGRKLTPYSEESKTEENEVKGCQSKVWLTHTIENGSIYFQADSNTSITKGIVAMLVFLWSGLSASEIENASTDVLEKIKLRAYLTSQRSNGLTAMIQKMKGIASRNSI